jgi:hypothetical protein
MLTIIASGCVVLSGCATLGKDECLYADWRTIGYEDGAHGFSASRIGSHREACAKHGIAPDFDLYEQGRLQGLGEYCTLQKGYGLGVSGKPYVDVCPEVLEPAFLEGYSQGKIVHGAQMEVKRLKSDLKKMYRDLNGVTQKLGEFENELVRDNSIGPRRRKYLLEEIKILTDQQRVLAADIDGQEVLLESAELQLHELQAQRPY